MKRKWYAYLTETPDAPYDTDSPLGTDGQITYDDIGTLRGVIWRLENWCKWRGKSYKVFHVWHHSGLPMKGHEGIRLVHVARGKR